MRLVLLTISLFVLTFSSRYSAQEVYYIDLYIEDGVEGQEFFTEAIDVINQRLVDIKQEYQWFPVDPDNPIKVVVCDQPEFCTQFVDSDSVLWFLFVEINSDIPISGTSGQASVNVESPTWQAWTDSEKRIFLTGEVFRVIESRLGVWANQEEGSNYIDWDIPEWLWLGSPIVLAADIFPDDGQSVLSQIDQIYIQTGLGPSQLHYQDANQYWSSVYVTSQLIYISKTNANSLLEYYYLVGTGTPQDEAFEQVFGIVQSVFEEDFDQLQ